MPDHSALIQATVTGHATPAQLRDLPEPVQSVCLALTALPTVHLRNQALRAVHHYLSSAPDRPLHPPAIQAIVQPWLPPRPVAQPSLPPFPAFALPAWLARYVQAESAATQTPADLAGLLALAALATACAGWAQVNPWDHWREPLNLYTLVALPSASRKSAVFSHVAQPILRFEASLAPTTAAVRSQQANHRAILTRALHHAQSRAARDDPQQPRHAQRAADLSQQLDRLPRAPLTRLVTDDCSPERLVTLLAANHGRLALLSPEVGLFDILAGRYNRGASANLDAVLKAHAGDPILVERVTRASDFVPQPALTIGLTVQPRVLATLGNQPSFRGRGLLARFLYAVPAPTLGHRQTRPTPVPANLAARYHQHVRALLQYGQAHLNTGRPAHVLTMSPQAANQLAHFAAEIEQWLAPGSPLQPISDWLGKLLGATARLAGLLHLAAATPANVAAALTQPIPADQASHAIQLARYLVPHARAAFDHIDQRDPAATADPLVETLRRLSQATIERRALWRATHRRYRSPAALDAAIHQLIKRGLLRPIPLPRAATGRPHGGHYAVHPHLWHPAD
ncbi:MAG: YfjI family protein [Chloroflexota bacterium]